MFKWRDKANANNPFFPWMRKYITRNQTLKVLYALDNSPCYLWTLMVVAVSTIELLDIQFTCAMVSIVRAFISHLPTPFRNATEMTFSSSFPDRCLRLCEKSYITRLSVYYRSLTINDHLTPADQLRPHFLYNVSLHCSSLLYWFSSTIKFNLSWNWMMLFHMAFLSFRFYYSQCIALSI